MGHAQQKKSSVAVDKQPVARTPESGDRQDLAGNAAIQAELKQGEQGASPEQEAFWDYCEAAGGALTTDGGQCLFDDLGPGMTPQEFALDQSVEAARSELGVEAPGESQGQFWGYSEADLFNMGNAEEPREVDVQRLEAFLGAGADDKVGQSESLHTSQAEWDKWDREHGHLARQKTSCNGGPAHTPNDTKLVAYVETNFGAGFGGGYGVNLDQGEVSEHAKLGLTTPGLSADVGMAKAECFEGGSYTVSAYGPLGGGITLDEEGNWCGAHLGIGKPGVGMSYMQTRKADH